MNEETETTEPGTMEGDFVLKGTYLGFPFHREHIELCSQFQFKSSDILLAGLPKAGMKTCIFYSCDLLMCKSLQRINTSHNSYTRYIRLQNLFLSSESNDSIKAYHAKLPWTSDLPFTVFDGRILLSSDCSPLVSIYFA